LMMLDAILQRGQSSRLYQSLVYEQKLAAEAASEYELRTQPGLYTLLAILSEGKSADDGLKSLQAEVARIRSTLVSDAELDEARNELITEALRNRETSEGRADELARSVVLFGDPAAFDNILARLQKVTAAEVQRVAQSVMDDTRSVTIRYLPEKPGVKGDVVTESKAIEPVKIDIPATDIPAYALAPVDLRKAPPLAATGRSGPAHRSRGRTRPRGSRRPCFDDR
jgi:zinc protease